MLKDWSLKTGEVCEQCFQEPNLELAALEQLVILRNPQIWAKLTLLVRFMLSNTSV